LKEKLEKELEGTYEERRSLTCHIFKMKQQVIDAYRESMDQLNQLIKNNQTTLKNYKIEIDASLVKKKDFNSKFLGSVNQTRKGTFRSADEGERQLLKLLADTDFDNEASIISLLDSLVDALRFDKRSEENDAQRDVRDQVKDISTLYDYLFSLEFLENNYQLEQGGKGLEQLSPGERGALLLVFYLLLDHSDIPLIIDQPEDNLDNHSVATVLVPFIREAKKRRQIIMVTHNPNLAVVADAEQIIYVNLDKENDYTFSTISGSIENNAVNQKIVEVLEGAMPAFNMRKQKYHDQ
jgi:predicted ATPase